MSDHILTVDRGEPGSEIGNEQLEDMRHDSGRLGKELL